MKKLFSILSIIVMVIIVTSSVAPVPISAQSIQPGTVPNNDQLGLPKSPITQKSQLLAVVAGIVQVVYWVFFAVATIMFIWAAYKYATEGENPEEIKKVHWMLFYGAVAVAVALLAVGVSAIVHSFLTAPGTGGAPIDADGI